MIQLNERKEGPASDRTGKGRLSTELRNGGNTPDVLLIVLCALGIDPFSILL